MKKTTNRFADGLFLLLFVFFISSLFLHCDDGNDSDPKEGESEGEQFLSACKSQQPEITQAALVNSNAKWRTEQIDVCWLNSDEFSKEDLEFIEQTIKNSWDKYIDLDFVYWKKCFTGLEQIKIRIADETPRSVIGSGYYYKFGYENLQWTMVLNFQFNNWSPICKKTEANRKRCMQRNAIHEFGHAIGFQHEQYRKDTPQWCIDELEKHQLAQPNTNYGDYYVGDWDENSIMNYCSGARELSCTDVAAGVFLYGEEND